LCLGGHASMTRQASLFNLYDISERDPTSACASVARRRSLPRKFIVPLVITPSKTKVEAIKCDASRMTSTCLIVSGRAQTAIERRFREFDYNPEFTLKTQRTQDYSERQLLGAEKRLLGQSPHNCVINIRRDHHCTAEQRECFSANYIGMIWSDLHCSAPPAELPARLI
jgi:hypothetical protein